MAEEPANLVLEYLRRFDARLDRMEHGLEDLKFRIGALKTSVAHVQTVLAHHSKQFDQIGARLGRIERRLDLVGAG